MKTEQLINALAEDQRRSGPPTGAALTLAFLAGLAVSAALFVATLGVRGDIASALRSWQFDFKLTIVVAALAAALAGCRRMAAPSPRPLWGPLDAIAPALLLVGLGYDLVRLPSADWLPTAVGTNALLCLLAIPLLALPMLVSLVLALRTAAPASPVGAGLMAGRVAAACASVLYATHCIDDAALFVAAWYSVSLILTSVLGALTGRHLLRW